MEMQHGPRRPRVQMRFVVPSVILVVEIVALVATLIWVSTLPH